MLTKKCTIFFKCIIYSCYTLVLNAGCFDSAVRLRAGSLCGVLIMLIRHALHAFEKYGRTVKLMHREEWSRRRVTNF